MTAEMEVEPVPNIKPVSDLRNYNEVLKECKNGEPVFLTKNGRGKYVLLDIKDYERQKAVLELLSKLAEAENAIKTGNEWLSLEDVRARFGG